MHNKITRREFALRVAALAAGAATGSFRTVNAGQAVNPSVEKTTANLSFGMDALPRSTRSTRRQRK